MAESGIYEIVNRVNGKRYIGSAVLVPKRWREHRGHLNRGTHPNRHLQSSWMKHGEANFEFGVLTYCDPEILLEAEQFYIDTLHPEYNIARVAGSCRGVKHKPRTAEHRQKISAAAKEAWDRKRQSGDIARAPFSEEHRENLSEAQRLVWRRLKAAGYIASPKSESHRAALSAARKKMFADGYRMQPRSPEHSEALRQVTIRSWADPEIKERRRAAIKADWARRKAAGYKHPPLTDQQRERQRAAVKAAWERRKASTS